MLLLFIIVACYKFLHCRTQYYYLNIHLDLNSLSSPQDPILLNNEPNDIANHRSTIVVSIKRERSKQLEGIFHSLFSSYNSPFVSMG